MLKISVQTGGIEEAGMTPEKIISAYHVIKEAGFDAVDANLDHLVPYRTIVDRQVDPVWLTEGDEIDLTLFDPWKRGSEETGVANGQAHAPFPSFVYDEGDGAFNAGLLNMLKKIIRGCAYIGCRCLIIHPFFTGMDHKLSPEQEWENNISAYSTLIETAKKYHVTICLENMFSSWNGKIYEACCSDIGTACRYIDTLNEIAGEKVFGFCLDTGHLLLLGKDVKDAMIRLGDRISAFHVHDNNGISDQHLAPYFGIQDWDRFAEGLKAIHYQGQLSFETFNVLRRADRELMQDLLCYIRHCGEMFCRRAGL